MIAFGSGLPAAHLTTFTITVDSTPLPGTYGIVGIDISREVDRVPTLSMVLEDGDAAAQTFDLSSAALLVPGAEIEVEAGYSSEESLLFKGVVTAQRIQVRRRGTSRLHVEARHHAYRMTLDRKSQHFLEVTDGDVIEELLGAYPGLTADVGVTTLSHPEIIQYNMTDWDLLVSRAGAAGMVCIPEDGALRVTAPSVLGQAAATLAYGKGVLDLDLKLDARTQSDSVRASAWDATTQEVGEADSDDAPSPTQGNLSGPDLAGAAGTPEDGFRHSGAIPAEELDGWVTARMLRTRFARVRGTIQIQGTEAIRPGDSVELEGLGDRFNGQAYVSGVHHALGRGDWLTTVQIGLDPRSHFERFPAAVPMAAAPRPPVHGLQIGVVTALQDDPGSNERIRVRLPAVDQAGEGTWARLAAPDAGAERGWVFRPEIDDEVVVGFLDGDPREAIVLGQLHSGAKASPFPASDDNHEKGLVTRSGMRLVFDDDAPSLTVETPGGRMLVLTDGEEAITIDDGTGNTITLDGDGVTIETGGNLTLSASGDVSIEGANVELKATSGSFKAEGSSGAEVSSSGTTDIKGSLVQIN